MKESKQQQQQQQQQQRTTVQSRKSFLATRCNKARSDAMRTKINDAITIHGKKKTRFSFVYFLSETLPRFLFIRIYGIPHFGLLEFRYF
jgi:hypothetical protein